MSTLKQAQMALVQENLYLIVGKEDFKSEVNNPKILMSPQQECVDGGLTRHDYEMIMPFKSQRIKSIVIP